MDELSYPDLTHTNNQLKILLETKYFKDPTFILKYLNSSPNDPEPPICYSRHDLENFLPKAVKRYPKGRTLIRKFAYVSKILEEVLSPGNGSLIRRTIWKYLRLLIDKLSSGIFYQRAIDVASSLAKYIAQTDGNEAKKLELMKPYCNIGDLFVLRYPFILEEYGIAIAASLSTILATYKPPKCFGLYDRPQYNFDELLMDGCFDRERYVNRAAPFSIQITRRYIKSVKCSRKNYQKLGSSFKENPIPNQAIAFLIDDFPDIAASDSEISTEDRWKMCDAQMPHIDNMFASYGDACIYSKGAEARNLCDLGIKYAWYLVERGRFAKAAHIITICEKIGVQNRPFPSLPLTILEFEQLGVFLRTPADTVGEYDAEGNFSLI